jgi:hypothetical protein
MASSSRGQSIVPLLGRTCPRVLAQHGEVTGHHAVAPDRWVCVVLKERNGAEHILL